MSREIVPGQNWRLGFGLGFGDVVIHPSHGPGMIYAVTSDGSLMIAFEEGCVCTGYKGLRYIGSIFDLEIPAIPARKSNQNLLGNDET